MATKNKRTRNVLCLEDKVRVIKSFSRKPCYATIANAFQCSSNQIKCIILDKRNVLEQHAMVQSELTTPVARDIQHLDYKKFEIIHKVVFEWYLRARCYPGFGPVTYKMIRERVLDARKALHIATFIPTNAWLVNFRKDCDRCPPDKNANGKTLMSLDMRMIAKSVLDQLGISLDQMKSTYGIGSYNENGINDQVIAMEVIPKLEFGQIGSLSKTANPFNIRELESQSDKMSDDGDTETLGEENRKDYSFIKSSEDALKYLKPLEEFVLLRENFRAIGLITQIEAIFLKTCEK